MIVSIKAYRVADQGILIQLRVLVTQSERLDEHHKIRRGAMVISARNTIGLVIGKASTSMDHDDNCGRLVNRLVGCFAKD